MGHALLDETADWLEGGEKARVSGPIVFGEEDAHALVFAMVCQNITHDNTVGREVKPLQLTPSATRWVVEVERRSGPAFSVGMATASALAIFTNAEGEFASYSWTDCIQLGTGSPHGEHLT